MPLSRKYLFAILSGVMLSASFPPPGLSFLAWIALVPLFKSLDRETFSQGFRLGLLAGLAHYLTLIYWIVVVLGHYGGLGFFSSFGPLLLLCLYLSLYPALFSAFTTLFKGSGLFAPGSAALWVGLEYLQAKLLSGFPWCLLGYTQYKNLHFIQIADVCGVYGVSFLLVFINAITFRLFFWPSWRKARLIGGEIVVGALALGATLAYGYYHLDTGKTEKHPHKRFAAVIVQGNIDQSVKWNSAYRARTMASYQRLSRASFEFGPDLIVWPETAVPFFFQDRTAFSQGVQTLSKESGAAIIFGSPAYRRRDGRIEYYNRAYLISSGKGAPLYYNKVHLVPFGEYVPLRRLLFFVRRLVAAAGDFQPGDRIAPLRYSDFSAGILICFEAIFPELARIHTREGANLLVNITNDAWFGKTSAPYQHLCMAVFRAVENRRPLIRAANTGISAFISPEGRITAQSPLFQEAVLKTELALPRSLLTIYARFGDVFAVAAITFSLLAILCLVRRR